jgi:phycoerythrin-associated linker protein
MTIEHFVAQCIGEWRSMRTGHSLAFQIFEDVTSEIRIKSVREDSDEVKDLLSLYKEESKL